ncbi:proline-rich receptor-like protein kinase PERK1 [Tanacetum coccineum]|uniref:non-specific serine/threonine protein kinase n=1 Tax=Tanacetum coccineum TaxID=301880 RepID=A0ABQ5AH07_9ASTR
MAPAPEAAPAPKTPSSDSDSNSETPSDDYSSSPPPPPSASPPPPPVSRPPPPPPKIYSPPPPSTPNKEYSPPPPIITPPQEPPPNIRPKHGNDSNKASPGPTNKLPNSSSRKSAPRPSPDADVSNSSTNDIPIIIGGIAVAIVVFLALFIVCILCNRKKKKPYYIREEAPGVNASGPYYNGKPDHVVKFSNESSGPTMSGASPNMPLAFSKSQFSYDELATATEGFTQYNLLGQGGFGYVHKGVLPNGEVVAVKSLKAGSGQGEREFQAEVEIISRVHHRYLVSLVGYCISDMQRMLVYEYVPNNTLEFHLHGKSQVVMDWQTRMRIALGSAKGLAYLHEDCHPRIIHRDIKSANILLDNDFEAKVADFGLARLTSENDTHVSTRVMGTFGYLAPEYASSGKLSDKSDVFSFGVMLLEIVTGRKPIDPTTEYMDESLVDWARPLIAKAKEDGDYSELVDPRLKDNYDHNEMALMASCASAAVRHSAKRRPKMSQIVRALEGNASLESLDEKTAREGSTLNISETRAYDTRAYNDDMMKFKKMVMSSEEYSSSEMGSSGPYG